MTILEIKNICKRFDDQLVLDNISLSIAQKEFFTLLGPSGCGKTTLLRMIAGFVTPDSGEILLEGKNISNLLPEERPLHTIFQSYALFPHLTVFDNVAFALKMGKMGYVEKAVIKDKVESILADVKLAQFAKRYPNELSGGQKQRVAIARALVDKPKILLLDEPLSALDANLRELMHVELVKLQEESGVTFIYVTHDQSEALALSTRIAVMNSGHVEQLDTPQQIYANPRTSFIAGFLGKCNLLPATVTQLGTDTIRLKVADAVEFDLAYTASTPLRVGDKGKYALRPEKLKANRSEPEDDHLCTIQAKVKGYYYYGDLTLYEFLLTNSGCKIQVTLPNMRSTPVAFFADNEEVVLSFEPQAGSFLLE